MQNGVAQKPETTRFSTHSQTTDDGRYDETTYRGLTDAFVVRFPEHNALFWVPVEEATTRKMELRFDSEIDHPSINWGDEFRLDERLSSF